MIISVVSYTQDDVLVKFRNVNQYENNLYLDNINIQSILTSNPEEITIEYIIYPNPTNNLINIEITSPKFTDIHLYISNVLGERVYSKTINVSNESSLRIGLEGFSKGIYFVNLLTSDGELYTKQLSYIK